MAENSNYIGIAMGLDVTDLKAGLTEANKRIQEANSEFKAASSGMDDWSKSTEGLQAKVKQLSSVLDAQKSKLSGLEAEYEKVAKEQGENSDAARNLQIQINGQKAVVNKTQKELDNYTDTLKQAEEGTIDLEEVTLRNGKAISKMGDVAEEAGGKVEGGFGKGAAGVIAGGIAAIGGAAVAAVGSFLSLAESTRETRVMMGKLEGQFETAGLSAEQAADTYSTLYGVFGDTGKASEAAAFLGEMAGSQEELDEMTRALTGTYAKWGEAIAPESLAEGINHSAKLGEVQGTLADALEWSGVTVDDFNVKLAECATEQERQELIVSTLNGLYGEQADAFNELNEDVIAARKAEEELNLALAELGKIAEPIMTMLKTLATETLEAITPFVQLIGEGLQGALEGSAGATEKLAEGISGIVDFLLERLTNLLPMVGDIILQLAPKIIETLLSMLPTLLDVITDLVVQILDLLSVLLPDIATKIVELIPVLIEQLLAATPQLLEAAIQLLMAIVQALPVIIESLISALPSLLETISSALITAIPLLLDAAIKLFNSILDALPVIIDSLIVNLPKIVNTIIDFLISAIPMLLEGAVSLLMAIIDALPVIINLLVVEVPKIVRTITDTLLSRLPDLISAAIELFFGILEAIPEIQSELISQMPDIISSICEGLLNSIDDMIQAGKDLMAGLVEGIFDFDFKKAISGLGDKVVGAFNKVFDSHSPSRLIEDKVGVNVGSAVVPSNPSALAQVKKRLSAFSDFVSDNLGDIKANLDVNGGVSGGRRVGGGAVINAGMTVNYNGTLSRKKLKQMENDNYTAMVMRMKAEGLI